MTDERIIAYFLKELSEKELEEFEVECFDQEVWPAEIPVVEEELIDLYLRDELSRDRREKFERNYLNSPARQDRVTMAAALLRRVDDYNSRSAAKPKTRLENASHSPSIWQAFCGRMPALKTAVAIVLLVVVVGGIWMYVSHKKTGAILAIALNPSITTRGGESQTETSIRLPSVDGTLKAVLTLPPDMPKDAKYRVKLLNARGLTEPVEITETTAITISVLIPFSELERGEYALRVDLTDAGSGEPSFVSNYRFRLE